MTATRIYISPGVIAKYDTVTHVDAVRWTEFHKALGAAGHDFEPVNLFQYKQSKNFEELRARIEAAHSIFIHHESSLRTLSNGLGLQNLIDLLKRKVVYLQCDALGWQWLDLNPDDFLPLMKVVGVASRQHASDRSFNHVPLACIHKRPIFDSRSNVVLHLGRYQKWFNKRMAGVIKAMGPDFQFRIITYEEDAASIDDEIRSLPNVEVRGPIVYDRIAEEIGPVRFGLAFNNGPAPTGKVWEYLSLGLPVLYEHGISEEPMLRDGLGAAFDKAVSVDLKTAALALKPVDIEKVMADHSWARRANLWANILGKPVPAFDERQTAMQTTIDAPLNLLIHQGGTRVLKTVVPDHYYGKLFGFLRDPEEGRVPYRDVLTSKDLAQATQFRAKCIDLARYSGRPYEEVKSTAAFYPKSFSVEEAADIVLDNYLSMMNPTEPHSVIAKVDQFGRIVVIEGLHRTVINYASGFTSQPAIIYERDQKWLDFIDFFKDQGRSLYKNENAIYHQIKHPDFAGFKPIRQDRSKAILSAFAAHDVGKRGIDLGPMVGFYSHELGMAGYQMQAVEYEAKYAEAFKTLATMYDSKAEVSLGNIYDAKIEAGQYDFAIMLSIVYHLLRDNPERCEALLSDLQQKIPAFVIDTEERTGILPEARLRSLFPDFMFRKIFEGGDDRNVFLLQRGRVRKRSI